jgi:hypothetical protein
LLARSYTLAEPGYPLARPGDAVRLGSVSKLFTLLALQHCLERHGLSLESQLAKLPGLSSLGHLALGAARLEDVVCHRAGFPSRPDLRPDDLDNPLSEDALARDLGVSSARPGDVTRRLLVGDLDFRPTREPAYSNDGYRFLGEVASLLHSGDPGGYEDLVCDLFRLRTSPLLGSDPSRPRDRAETPAHPTLPSWAGPHAAPRLTSHVYRGDLLGPAAGWSISVSETLELAAPRLPRELRTTRAVGALEPSVGLYVMERTYGDTMFKGRTSSAAPVVRLMHSGRLHGGAALFLHECNLSGHDRATRTLCFAINRLHDLSYAIVGRPLLTALAPISLEV